MADTQAIKDRIDIVQLIGEYVTLKKAGANWKANCPFHHEKSASFMVHPEKQIWHCFGCGKGGDIFVFVQEMEGLDFVEALKLLAKRAGVPIESYRSEVNQSQRNRLLEIMSKASQFYHHILVELPAGQPAREYLEKRRLTRETIDAWNIGYVPDQWDLLTKYFLKKGIGVDDLVSAGLTIKREGAGTSTDRGYYDRFRGRIMFPIADVHGNVVGFTGRVLVENEHSGGKYVNTPQTLLYDKSRILYGLNQAKTAIKAADLAVLVEGQMDVIACHQAGMKNVVAASGTALTVEQIKLIKRYAHNIAMAFDADEAGQNAGKRGVEVALREGVNVKVIQLPSGFAKDADECIKKDSAVWFAAVTNARNWLEWYIERLRHKYDLRNPRQKQEAANLALHDIAQLPYAVERDDWINYASEQLQVDLEVMRSEAKRLGAVQHGRPGEPSLQPSITPSPAVTSKNDPLEPIATEFWCLMLKFPEAYASLRPGLRPDYFTTDILKDLYESSENIYTNRQKLDLEALRHIVHTAGVQNVVDVLQLKPYKSFEDVTPAFAQTELAHLIERMKETWRKKRGKELQLFIAQAERVKDAERIAALVMELQNL